jgi:anti-sigma factor RsiW
MSDEHILPLLSDYVLDLLPPAGRRRVEYHAANCPACRAALHAERQIGEQVRGTLAATALVENGRLRQLQPAGHPRQPLFRPQRQLALASLLCLLLFGAVGFGQQPAPGGWQPSLAYTATLTSAATATDPSTRQGETAVATAHASPTLPTQRALPPPQATPSRPVP